MAEPETALFFKSFLEDVPPCTGATVADLFVEDMSSGSNMNILNAPLALTLHCTSESCERSLFFARIAGDKVWQPGVGRYRDLFLSYQCRNCATRQKTYALRVLAGNGFAGTVIKFGEFPAFGPPIPSKVISLVRDERDYYVKGTRAGTKVLGLLRSPTIGELSKIKNIGSSMK